ncbi:MAG TPA: hypothetical protein VFV96_12130 [Verrucomicrobiae bacterium]|nr:hypothetical protein [Verrucomicrobiae bacterium]
MNMLADFSKKLRFGLLVAISALAVSARAGVDFPGPAPGTAAGSSSNGVFTLENAVIAGSWQYADGQLRPLRLNNRLTGTAFDQSSAELFRLGLTPPEPQTGVMVAVRLERDRVVALASRDGRAWTELATFPRAEFGGEPKLVRLGKMNLEAQAKNYSGDLGGRGQCTISDFNLAKVVHAPEQIELKARANQAEAREFSFPAGATFVSCRIDKGTDQGLSWAPALALIWEDGKKFLLVGVRDAKPVFNVMTAANEKILEGKLNAYPNVDLLASAFRLNGTPKIVRLSPSPDGVRVADRLGGVALEAEMVSAGGLRAHWRAELRDGSSYLRQTLQLSSPDKTVPLFAVELADIRLPGAQTIGTVPGCPVAGGGMFAGVEMPGAENAVDKSGARIGLACRLELSPAQAYTFGAVAGVAPAGQLRRAFLYYVERERARPSSPFLHYNDWYDLGFSVDAGKILEVVTNFNEELVKKRGVPVQSYLVDDGWDDPGRGLWTENTNKFPGGFAALKAQLDQLDAHLAIWISPMGGYGGNAERTADAQQLGLIPPGAHLDFVYPRYKEWFQNRCLQLMREAGVNAFKWDKAGEGVSPHFMALLDIAEHLRRENPQVFINVTVGTWPSPFWLNYVDSTWRDGSADVGWAGKGDDREQWLTYRDGECRRLFVERSPLYPLNSIMAHGIVFGRHFQGERVAKAGPHLKHEARSYFAIGASLQELYLTPALMTPEAWDDVADAAKWARTNAAVLVDSHWVGGDPLQLQVYGYASWNPQKGTLMLRNPDDRPQSFTLDAQTIFELPAGAARRYAMQSPYADQRVPTLSLTAGQPQRITLEPFEVLVFDARPD